MRNAITHLSIVLSICCTGQAASQLTTADAVRLQIIQGRPIVNDVFLNGQGPYRFLLDTGAQTNQLAADISHHLGLKPEYRVAFTTSSGITQVGGGHVNRLSVGSAAAEGQEFLFTSLEGARALDPGIQGVLGQEFLSHFDYLLDFAKRRIVFGSPKPSNGNAVKFERIDRRPAVTVGWWHLYRVGGSGLRRRDRHHRADTQEQGDQRGERHHEDPDCRGASSFSSGSSC